MEKKVDTVVDAAIITAFSAGIVERHFVDDGDILTRTEIFAAHTSDGSVAAPVTINTNKSGSGPFSVVVTIGSVGQSGFPDQNQTINFGGTGNSTFNSASDFTATGTTATRLWYLDEGTVNGAVTTGTLQTASNPISTTCTCEFAQWGVWNATVVDTSAPANVFGQIKAMWISGSLTSNVPATGTAYFSGGMAGYTSTSGGSLVNGTYVQNWNFANRNGSFSANFDSRTYSSSSLTAPTSAPGVFSGTGTGTGGATMSVNGAFVGSGVTGVIGHFNVSGTGGYTGGGVLAAVKTTPPS